MRSGSRVVTARARRLAWGPDGAAILLAAVGGGVDAVGWLTLFHLFMGFMSGNSIMIGVHLGTGQWEMIMSIAQESVAFLFRLRDRPRGEGITRRSTEQGLLPPSPSRVRLLLFVGVWVAYVAGAAAAAYGVHRWATVALALPVTLILVAIALDLWRPLETDSPGAAGGG